MLEEQQSRSSSIKTPDVEVIPPAAPVAVAITAKKKLNKADFMFVKRKNETLVKMPGDINGIDFKIADLDNCVVILLDYTA